MMPERVVLRQRIRFGLIDVMISEKQPGDTLPVDKREEPQKTETRMPQEMPRGIKHSSSMDTK